MTLQNAGILIEWGDPPSPVEWQLSPRPDDTALVCIARSGFAGSKDEVVADHQTSTAKTT